MRKSLASIAAAAAFIAPAGALAQASPPVTGNLTLVSDYRFRGITQTFERPALQGGFDYAHASGLYVGNWNSNVSSVLFPNANLEMDFYGGWKGAFGHFGVDVGAIYYYYPGSSLTATGPQGGSCTNCRIDNTELYVGGSWRWLSAKYYYAISDFFAVPDTEGSSYLDLSGSLDMGSGWGLAAHVGRQRVKNLGSADYTDWKLGLTKDLAGWVFGAAYVDTNAKGGPGEPYNYSDARKTIDGGDAGLVLSVGKTF